MIKIKRYDVVIPRKYEDKNGDEKTAWSNVGTIVIFPATEEKEMGIKLELPIFGHDKFKVFLQKPKTAQNGGVRAGNEVSVEDMPENATEGNFDATSGIETQSGIGKEDIPF